MRGWPLPLFVRRLVDLIAAKLTRSALPILLGRAGVRLLRDLVGASLNRLVRDVTRDAASLLHLDHPRVVMDCPGRIRPTEDSARAAPRSCPFPAA